MTWKDKDWEIIFQTSLGHEFIVDSNLDERTADALKVEYNSGLQQDGTIFARKTKRTPRVSRKTSDDLKVYETSGNSEKYGE